MNNYLILIAGIPGTGKTTFATYLSERLHIPMVSKDLVKEELFDTIGFKSREEKVVLGIAAMTVAYHFVESHLKVGVPVILENNFETATKSKLLMLMEKYPCKVLSVVFRGDPAIIYERVVKRDLSPERHLGHVSNTQYPLPVGETKMQSISQTTPEQFFIGAKQRGMLDFDIGDEVIAIDTTDFNTVSYEDILMQVKSFIEKCNERF